MTRQDERTCLTWQKRSDLAAQIGQVKGRCPGEGIPDRLTATTAEGGGEPSMKFHLWLAIGAATVSFVCAALLATWASRRWWAGDLLLNATKRRSRWWVMFWTLYVTTWLIALFFDRDLYILTFTPMIAFSSAISHVMTGALEIRERGIFHQAGLIPWNRIKQWRWEDAGGGTMLLWSGATGRKPAILGVELARPRFFRDRVRIPVPVDHVEAFSQVLNEHVPEPAMSR